MKTHFCTIVIATFISFHAGAQENKDHIRPIPAHTAATFGRGDYIAGFSAGFLNSYRNEYTVPAGYEKGNVTGFIPVYLRGEYGISNRVSLGVSFGYSTLLFNSHKVTQGYNDPIRRYVPNKWRLLNAGVTAYYHFNHLLNAPKLDVFVGGGLCLNNILETRSISDDTLMERKSHTIQPILKAGVRYYINPVFSLYADAGYDKLSIFSLGFSCRLTGKHISPAPADK